MRLKVLSVLLCLCSLPLPSLAIEKPRCDREISFEKLSPEMQSLAQKPEGASGIQELKDTPFHMIYAYKVVPWTPELVFGVITSFAEHAGRINGVLESTIVTEMPVANGSGRDFFIDYKIDTGYRLLPKIRYQVRDRISRTCDAHLLEISLEKEIFLSPAYIDGIFKIQEFEGKTLILHCLYAEPKLKIAVGTINEQGLARTRQTITDFETWLREVDADEAKKEKVLQRLDVRLRK